MIQGEISNAKLHTSGHFYFDLKDAHAKISAVMFRAQYSQLTHPPKEGDQVVVKGNLSVYPPQGRYQLLVRSLEYRGVGELLLQLSQLKEKLKERGWFSSEKKKKLPKFPRTIGVVTSPTGAVIRDIVQVLTRRCGNFHLILNPVRVQGEGASNEIALAIEQFNRHKLADVLIIGRGGGSLEDLWAFNEEIVAKAIFESEIPTISAVGHESDVTIADFVADVRAPTPSAAAEIVTAERVQQIQHLKKAGEYASQALWHLVKQYRIQLRSYERSPFFSTSYALLSEPMQRLDEMKTALDYAIRQEILKWNYLLSGKQKEMYALDPTQLLLLKKQKLSEITKRLEALNPKNVLKRGYALLFSLNEGSVIVSAQELKGQEKVRALLADGEVTLKVEK